MTASGSAPSWASAPRCAPSTWIPREPSNSTSSPPRPTGSSRCCSRGARDERRPALHPVPSPVVPPARVRLVVAREGGLHSLCPARAHQSLRGLLRGRHPLAAPRPRPGPGGVWAVPRPAEDAALPRARRDCLPVCPLPCHHLAESDPQGHGRGDPRQASACLGHPRSELRGLARALGSRGRRVATRVDRATDHAASLAPVQRRRDSRRVPLPHPSLSDRPGLPPGMARGTSLRVPPPPRDTSGDTPLSLRPHPLAPLPLGPSLPVHALRWAAVEASDRAHRRPVLWGRAPGNGGGRLLAVEHRLAIDDRGS